MRPNPSQRVIDALNRLYGPRNAYFDSLNQSPEAAFAYSFRSGEVVYRQFDGFNDFQDRVVLDFGCGGGGKTVYYATRGPRRMLGVDAELDRAPAEAAARERRLRVEFIPFTGEGRIPLKDDACDYVIASSVLEHVADVPAALREIRRVLRPEGLFLNRWHPYRSRHGAHLGAAIGIPFAHLLFRERDLMRCYHRLVCRRLGTFPATLGPARADSESFADLAYPLNRATVRQMRLALEAAGFGLVARRFLRGTRRVRLPHFVPESWVDYLVDYEAQVCAASKPRPVRAARRRGSAAHAGVRRGGLIDEINVPQPV